MRELTVIHDLVTRDWDFTELGESDYNISIYFKFVGTDEIVSFNNLSFGYSVSQQQTCISSSQFPKPGIRYVSTDQSYLESIAINLEPEKTYILDVWSIEDGVESTSTYEIVTKIPPSPYPSWIWNNGVWVPPIDYPPVTPNEMYIWDESTLSWQILSSLPDTSGYEVT